MIVNPTEERLRHLHANSPSPDVRTLLGRAVATLDADPVVGQLPRERERIERLVDLAERFVVADIVGVSPSGMLIFEEVDSSGNGEVLALLGWEADRMGKGI